MDNTVVYFNFIAEEMLQDFSLSEIFEMNDLTNEHVLEILLNYGVISEPERYFE